MTLKVINYNSSDYKKMLKLRDEILRKPLGLAFSQEYLDKERNDIFCVCKDADKIIGCCILTPINKSVAQLRQMAVDNNTQGKGIGVLVLQFAEKVAKEKDFKKIILHARESAVNFYAKYGYKIISDEFIEIGISHLEMEKVLKV